MKRKNSVLFVFVLFVCQIINAQTGSLQGKVTEKDGKTPIPFANLIIESKGKQIAGATTDIDGKYIIRNIPQGKHTLKVTFIGFKGVKLNNVIIKPDQITYVNITMEANTTLLEEVEVFEYRIPLIDKGKSAATDSKIYYDSETSSSVKSKRSSTGTSKSGYVTNSKDSIIFDSKYSHMLTAGEINDYTKWILWNDISKNELSEFAKLWNILPKFRYCVQLTNKTSNPVVNATVQLLDKNKKIVWETKTDNTGKAELWSNLFSTNETDSTEYSISIEYKNDKFKIRSAIPFAKGVNSLKLPIDCDYSNDVDLMFVVDATSSMTDEIRYFKAELLDIINQVKSINSQLTIHLGSVFYRDKGDDYVTVKNNFSTDISKTLSFISAQEAAGGGDYEEAVDEALEEAINNCTWSSEARTRILFLVLDAPPHPETAVFKHLEKLFIQAAEKGIRIVPIMGSGISKSTEYLFRSMALATNGTYVFLTDDSGIGDSHIKPTTDQYKVELLNDLLIRLIKQFSFIPECNKTVEFIPEELKPDTTFLSSKTDTASVVDSTKKSQIPIVKIEKPSWKIYPNPTSGEITVEITGNIIELFITDNSGKILEKVDATNSESIHRIDLSKYPNGIYFVRYYYAKDCSVVGKVILNR